MPDAHAAQPRHRTAYLTIALCYLVALFEGFDLQAAGVAAPKLGPAFHAAPDQLGWFFSSSTFGLILGATLGGRLSDRFGRKTVLLVSVAFFGLMSLATGAAPQFRMLLAARFLTGLGIGGALPTLVSLVSENTAPAQRHTAVGFLYAGLPSGGALASLLAALVRSESWSTVFIVGGIAPLVAVPLLAFLLPESVQIGAPARTRATSATPRQGFAIALFSEGRTALTLGLWLSFFLALLTMYLLLNWLPTLIVARGLSKADASLVQLSFNILGACGSAATGWLMDRSKPGLIVVTAFGAAAGALLLLAGTSGDLAKSLLFGGLVGLTMSATQAILYAMAPSIYSTPVRGTGVGSAVAVGRLGSAAGPLLAGALLTAGYSAQHVLTLLTPVILTAGAVVLALRAALRRRSATGMA